MLKELKPLYSCRSCNEPFENESDCEDHEQSCKGILVNFKCGFCGNVITYLKSNIYNLEEEIKKNCCHTLTINKTGYGSAIEDHDVEIPICDDCAKKLDDAAIFHYGE